MNLSKTPANTPNLNGVDLQLDSVVPIMNFGFALPPRVKEQSSSVIRHMAQRASTAGTHYLSNKDTRFISSGVNKDCAELAASMKNFSK